jgi:hypothetical protein
MELRGMLIDLDTLGPLAERFDAEKQRLEVRFGETGTDDECFRKAPKANEAPVPPFSFSYHV